MPTFLFPITDHRTEFFSPEPFRYEASRDVYICPAGKELHLCRGNRRTVNCATGPMSRTVTRARSKRSVPQ